MTIREKAEVLRNALAKKGLLVEIADDASQIMQLEGYALYPFGIDFYYQFENLVLCFYAERYSQADFQEVEQTAHTVGFDIVVAFRPSKLKIIEFHPYNASACTASVDRSNPVILYLFPLPDEGTPPAARRHQIEIEVLSQS